MTAGFWPAWARGRRLACQRARPRKERTIFVRPSTEPVFRRQYRKNSKNRRQPRKEQKLGKRTDPGRGKNWASSLHRALVDHLVIEQPSSSPTWASERVSCQPRPAGSRPASSHQAGQLAGCPPPESRPSLTPESSSIFVSVFSPNPGKCI